MPELDVGTLTRMAHGIIKFGYTKQIQIADQDVNKCLEALKTRSRKRNIVYMADGLNMFIDLDMWSASADEWRAFLAAREQRPRVTPKKAGVSPTPG